MAPATYMLVLATRFLLTVCFGVVGSVILLRCHLLPTGRNCATLFDPALRANIEERVNVTREMRAALEGGGGLKPFYQP